MEKTEKSIKELEYYELKRKAQENKPMTQDELKRLQSYKTREVVNQVLRVFGLLTSMFIFVLTFDIFAEGAIWGVFSGKCGDFWNTMIDFGYVNILWAIFNPTREAVMVLGCILMSIIHIALCIAIIYLLAFSIRDIYGFIKKLLASPIKLVKDVGGAAKESISTEVTDKNGKNLLFPEKKTEKKTITRKRKTVVESAPIEMGQSIEIPEVSESAFSNEELDRMLKGESLEDIRKSQEKPEESSLGLDDKIAEPVEEVIEKRVEENDFEKNLSRISKN